MLSEHVSLSYMLQYNNIAHSNKTEKIQVHVGPYSKQTLSYNTRHIVAHAHGS
jgi:hypothetical protein